LWRFLARAFRIKPNLVTDVELLKEQVRQHEAWIRSHEDDARDRAFRIEADLQQLYLAVRNLREEVESERKERFRTIMDGFSEASEGIVSRVLASVWSEMGISRADMRSLKERLTTLELRGEDGK
jgi:hypothetical protein